MPLRFPDTRDGWQFDLVGLLAIIGEASVSEIVQPLTAWRFAWLPRLLPAPHALIRPNRTAALPLNSEARVVGVRSGNITESLPYFADTIHAIELLDPYTVESTEVEIATDFRGFRARTFAPLNLLTLASFALTVGVLAWAIVLEDGPAVIAIILVSVAGSATSLASRWSVQLPPHGPLSRTVPPGDVVIFARNGSFVVVKCTETTARTLYMSGSQRCVYLLGRNVYQALVSAATVLLMFGIVIMANCTWVMQVVLGTSYLALNGVYLLAALSRNTPRRWLWDLTAIRVRQLSEPIRNRTFTQAVWHAIYETESIHWVRALRATPDTPAWDEWLRRAEYAAVHRDREFDPQQTLNDILSDRQYQLGGDAAARANDAAAQARPEHRITEIFGDDNDSDSDRDEKRSIVRRRKTALL